MWRIKELFSQVLCAMGMKYMIWKRIKTRERKNEIILIDAQYGLNLLQSPFDGLRESQEKLRL